MALTEEQWEDIRRQAAEIDKASSQITSRVVQNASNKSAQQQTAAPAVSNTPTVQPTVSSSSSLMDKATTTTIKPVEISRPGNVMESLFKTPNYISNSAMSGMAGMANSLIAGQQDSTADAQAREAEKKAAEQQKASLDKALNDLYQQMEGYKNNGQTDKVLAAEKEYADINERIAKTQAEINGISSEEAAVWEAKRYSEIMSTGDKSLMYNLRRLIELRNARMGEAGLQGDDRRSNLTETETQYNEIYNSLKSKYGDQVDGWVAYVERMGNKSAMAARMNEARRAAEDKPFWSSLGSVPLNMFSGAGYMDAVGQNIQRSITGSDAPIDYNSPAQSASKMTNTIRGTVSEDMSGVGKFLYNTGMSMADTLAAMPMGNFGMALLGGSAATNAMQTAIERGASDSQALKIGLAAGAMESVMEKLSIDRLFKLKTPEAARDVIMNILKQAGAEGTEEGLTTIANTLADAVVMGDKSELNTAKQAYMADSYSPDKAEGMALKDWGLNLLLDVAGGLLSGGMFSIGKTSVDSIMPKVQQETKVQPTVADITPTPQQAQETPTPASVAPKLQQTETVPIAEFRQTAAKILSEGIFDSPIYGEALEQTGMKRSDVRDALRTVARNNIAAASDPKVQVVLNVIRNVDAQPVQAQVEVAAQTAPEQTVSEVVSRMAGEPKGTAENVNFANESPKMQDDIHEIEPGAKPAMGAADAGFDPYSHASIEHGAVPPGENPARVVDVPKSVDGETNVMQTVRTIMEADATPDAAIPELEQAIVQGKFSKMPITDQSAADRAERTIKQVGYQQALADWRAEVRSGKVSKDSVVVGETLYNAAVNAKDYKAAVKIAVELSTQVRSAAQALQAIRMLKKMSPAAQLYGVKQSVDNLQKSLTDKYGKRAPNLVINEELAAKFLEAETEADRKSAEEALYKDIAKQIPATFADKWNAWRYLSMLGNFRTHVRNIAGNAMFAPVRFVKNKVGAAMEAGAQAVGLIDQSQRTKAFGAAGKDLMAAAKADYENVKKQVLSAGKYNSTSDIIEENRQIFNPVAAKAAGKVVKKLTGEDIPQWVENISLEGLRKGNSKLLEAEDSFFSKGAYASSLASYLKAQGFTAADFTGDGMTVQQKDAARAYAIKEAQKATYRDINGFSEAISSIGFKNPGDSKTKHALNAAIEGVMPFKKTPANILVRSVEYSPAGLLKAITIDAYAVANGKISAAEYMDRLSSGLTGTGLFALGWFLSNAGLLVGGTPEDEDQADLEGRQPYALEIDGKSITLDWLAPEAMPVFMGVELAEAIREGGGDASLTDKALSFIKGLSGPMLEMSMMSSLQDALEATEYADNKLLAFMANGALGYLKQAQPTLFGQLERALESSVRQTTFTQEGDKYLNKDAQYMVGSVANKVPFFDYNQVPYIDAWGRTEDLGGTGERMFNNLLNPAYVSDIRETPVDTEIKRLEEALGVNLTPSRAEKVLTIDKTKVILTANEYITYAQAKGQNDLTFRQNLIDSSAYHGLDDQIKSVAMEKAKELANNLAIQEAGFEPTMPDWQKELMDADAETITNTLVAKAIDSQLGTGSKRYEDMADYAAGGDLEAVVKLMLTDDQKTDYEAHIEKANVSLEVFLDALAFEADAKSETKDGKTVPGSKKAKVEGFINSLDLNDAQKTALYLSMPDNYSENKMPDWD